MKCFITNRECKYDRPEKSIQPDNHVFMISPFGFPFDDLYCNGIEPTVKKELNKTISRADQSLQLGYVMCQRICRRILTSTYIFADLTEPNGNVYYELGLALGLGKRLAILCNSRKKNPFLSPYLEADFPNLTYSLLKDLQNKDELSRLMSNAYRLPTELRENLHVNSPNVILRSPPIILNIVNNDCPSPDFHEIATNQAIEHFNKQISGTITDNEEGKKQLEPWHVETLIVEKNINIKESISKIAEAKICLFDVTHYEEKTNANIFFLLGVAHATEREVIPIINRPLNKSLPFDIRGLWQINYEKTDELVHELVQILPTIDLDFKKEKTDFLYHQIWDPFLAHKSIHVITCAREAPPNEDRGKRTDIDMWDFNSVSKLEFFIAQKYETAEVNIVPPKNKKTPDELSTHNKQTFHETLRSELAGKDCVIIGSPDVSDYAEVILADIHGLTPHQKLRSSRKLPYQFVKQTQNKNNPRRISAFYKMPSSKEPNDKVSFGIDKKIHIECVEHEDNESGKQVKIGHSCVVITFAKNPYKAGSNKEQHHIMVLSGFTGIATYAAILLLTHDEYRPELQRYFEAYEALLGKKSGHVSGVNFLLSIVYKKPSSSIQSGDNRELLSIHFKGAELIHESEPKEKMKKNLNKRNHT